MPTEAPDPYATFGKARDRFFRTALLLSGLSILAAGASRLPTWQVSAPVGWLVGTVNVGFLPTFGPILIVFGYSYLYLTWLAVVHTWRVLPRRADHAGPLGYEFGISAGHRDAAARLSLLVFRLWVFGVPILAHAILLSTYFDFCAPSANPQEQVRLCTLPRRALDLTLGWDGWSGYQPKMASIQDNLKALAEAEPAGSADRARIEQVAGQIPWIYPPWQTWLNLLGLAFIVYLARRAWSPPESRRGSA